MKKALFGTMLLATLFLFPAPSMAGVDVGVSVSLPPLVVFSAPPAMVVIPETYVYVVPDADVEIFFYDGWWWRPWEGRWYRSRHYDSGWVYYQRVPSFYSRIPRSWRENYRERRWGGRPWNYQPIPHQQVERNWSTWKRNHHWEKQQTWGVQGLKPRTQQRQAPRAVQPATRERSQPREAAEPRESRPRPQEAARPPQSRPQSGEVRQERSQPQPREAPKQSKPRQGKPERGEDGKQDGKHDDRR
jgi:hypothetical protein